MSDVYILGIYSSAVGRFPDKGIKEMVREVCTGALDDAGRPDPDDIGGVWFGNMLLDLWGQPYVGGQYCIAPLVNDGLVGRGTPVTNVEGACATGSLAFSGAVRAVQAGNCELAMGVGAEKMFNPEQPLATLERMERSMDWLDPQSWQALYARTAKDNGAEFTMDPKRSVAMDVYAMWAHSHMRRYGTTQEHMAAAAAKNHCNSVHNPRAQYQFPLTVREVLDDRVVTEPLTRAMCAPIGDGAAAVVVCSGSYLARCAPEIRERAVRIRAHELSSGIFDVSWEDERGPVIAATKAYRAAGLSPKDIDLVELHDASSFAEIHLIEDLGLCERGQGGTYTASGATAIDGEVAVNPSGGLVSRGHPLGATGVMMLNELCIQLRGEANGNAVAGAHYALAENGGGVLGNDVAVCSVTILERPDTQGI